MNSHPPVNVRFERPPDEPHNWDEEAQKWRDLNATPIIINGQSLIGHPGFYPLTIKAAYVIGVFYSICCAISHLLNGSNPRELYIPAYGLFASSMDLLGRCLTGNDTHYAKTERHARLDIEVGFCWLHTSSYPDFNNVSVKDTIITTDKEGDYSIEKLISLRHFVAHGQAAINTEIYKIEDVDYQILDRMPTLIATGLEKYWTALGPEVSEKTSQYMCNKLARANVAAFRNWPIHRSWFLFQGDGRGDSITNIFSQFNWHIR